MDEPCLAASKGPGSKDRTMMHIDMDCFFVSVGLRSHPHLRGLPVAVTHAKGGGSGRPSNAEVRLFWVNLNVWNIRIFHDLVNFEKNFVLESQWKDHWCIWNWSYSHRFWIIYSLVRCYSEYFKLFRRLFRRNSWTSHSQVVQRHASECVLFSI